jgi:hypothetical protein
MVKTLAAEGKDYIETRSKAEELGNAASEQNVQTYLSAKKILNEQWPVLRTRGEDKNLQEPAEELGLLLESDEALLKVMRINELAELIHGIYREIYEQAYASRKEAYEQAIDIIRGRPEYPVLIQNPELKEILDSKLRSAIEYAGVEMDLPQGEAVCRQSGATLGQLESDFLAAESFTREVIRWMSDEVAAPREQIVRVKLADVFPERITTLEEIRESVTMLQIKLEKSLTPGKIIIVE